MNYLPLPGKSFTHMPFRNLLRAPWRTIFTAIGISAAIAMLTLFVGFLDTFRKTIDVSKDMLEYQGKDRVVVTLDFFYPEDSDAVRTVTEITDDDGVEMIDDWQGNVTLGGTLKHSGEEIDTAITLLDMDSDIWVPKLKEGSHSTAPQTIIIAEKMAEDLNVKIGDSITVEHPRREGTLAFNMTDSTFEVVGIHTNPFRPLSYASLANRETMGIEGLVNELYVVPRDDLNIKDVREELFTQNSVGGVQGIDSIAAAFDEALELFEQFLSVTRFVVVFLAFLIAFNSTSINVDERVREIATMFAFGLPIRTVIRMQVVENFVIGILGTLLGIALGYVFLVNMLAARVEEQIQDMKFIIDISPQTLFVSVLLGVLVVALTPLLSIRKMSKMSIPDELRVME
jgi:putative ABC transport system permease protein